MIRIMMTYGFYKTSDEINNLFKPLLIVFNGIYDVSNLDEDDYIKNTKFRNKDEQKRSFYI